MSHLTAPIRRNIKPEPLFWICCHVVSRGETLTRFVAGTAQSIAVLQSLHPSEHTCHYRRVLKKQSQSHPGLRECLEVLVDRARSLVWSISPERAAAESIVPGYTLTVDLM